MFPEELKQGVEVMKYFKLYDCMAPEGDLYKVDEDTGEAWLVNSRGKDPIPAFPLSKIANRDTAYGQLVDYAGKYGRLEEVECPER